MVQGILDASAAFADPCAVLPQPLSVGKAYGGITARAIQRVGLGQFIGSGEFASHFQVMSCVWQAPQSVQVRKFVFGCQSAKYAPFPSPGRPSRQKCPFTLQTSPRAHRLFTRVVIVPVSFALSIMLFHAMTVFVI